MSLLVVSFSKDCGLNIGSFEKVKGAFITENFNLPSIKSSPIPPGYTEAYQTSSGLTGQLSFVLQDQNKDFIEKFSEAAAKSKNFDTLHAFEVFVWNGGKDKKPYYIPKRQLTLYNVSIELDAHGEAFSVRADSQFAEHKPFKQDDAKPSFKAGDPLYLDVVKGQLLSKLPTTCKPKEAEELKSGSN